MSGAGATNKDRLKFAFEQCGKTEQERYDFVDEYVNTDDSIGAVLTRNKISWPSNFDSFNGLDG
jgi:hypothetical protein